MARKDVEDAHSMVYSCVADVEIVTDTAEPIDEFLPLNQIVFVHGRQVFDHLLGIVAHLFQSHMHRDLNFKLYFFFSNGFHQKSVGLLIKKNKKGKFFLQF